MAIVPKKVSTKFERVGPAVIAHARDIGEVANDPAVRRQPNEARKNQLREIGIDLISRGEKRVHALPGAGDSFGVTRRRGEHHAFAA